VLKVISTKAGFRSVLPLRQGSAEWSTYARMLQNFASGFRCFTSESRACLGAPCGVALVWLLWLRGEG
jgi:hypothetical protein